MNIPLLHQIKLKNKDYLLITAAVLICHFAAFLLLVNTQDSFFEPKKQKRFVVKTVPLNPQKTLVAMAMPSAEAKESISLKPLNLEEEPQEAKIQPFSEPAAEEPISQEAAPRQFRPKAEEKPALSPPAPKVAKPAAKKKDAKPRPDPKAAKKTPVKKQAQKKAELKKDPKTGPKQEEKPKQSGASKEKQSADAKLAEAKKQQLLETAKQRMNDLSLKKNLPATPLASDMKDVKTIGSLNLESALPETENFTASEISYYDELKTRLKLQLVLPEFGEVKIKLTLDRQGGFASLQIISSKSGENKKYLEKMLPSLKYPAFGENFKNNKTRTFAICLSNE